MELARKAGRAEQKKGEKANKNKGEKSPYGLDAKKKKNRQQLLDIIWNRSFWAPPLPPPPRIVRHPSGLSARVPSLYITPGARLFIADSHPAAPAAAAVDDVGNDIAREEEDPGDLSMLIRLDLSFVMMAASAGHGLVKRPRRRATF